MTNTTNPTAAGDLPPRHTLFPAGSNDGVDYLSIQEHLQILSAQREESLAAVREAMADFLEELADRINVAHTAEMDLFPPFDTPEWSGANHFKVWLVNKLWIEADLARAQPAPTKNKEEGENEN